VPSSHSHKRKPTPKTDLPNVIASTMGTEIRARQSRLCLRQKADEREREFVLNKATRLVRLWRTDSFVTNAAISERNQKLIE